MQKLYLRMSLRGNKSSTRTFSMLRLFTLQQTYLEQITTSAVYTSLVFHDFT